MNTKCVKICLCSRYDNEMSIKYLKKYFSQYLLKCYFIGEYHCHVQFYLIEYNNMFNATQERNDKFTTMDKIKYLKTPVLVQPN